MDKSQLNNQNPQSVLFLHLPKTAGTTLINIITRQYRPREIYSFGIIVQDSIAQLEAMDAAERAKIRMLIGHMGYGLHELLAPPTTYFTILREPIDRVISFYHFVKRTGGHYLHGTVLQDNIGLDDFVKNKMTLMTDNFQVRLISGVWDKYPYGECPRAALEQAKQILQNNFTVVGLTEEFDKTLILLRRAFGWRNVFYLRQNVTKNRPQQDSFSQETLDIVRASNQLDLELYAFVQKLFAEQIAHQGISFALESRLFPWLNRLIRPMLKARSRRRRQTR